MKIYELEYFDSLNWSLSVATVMADSEEEAKMMVVTEPGVYPFKRSYPGDREKATAEEKMEWIEVISEKEAPTKGVIKIKECRFDDY